jgi:hypothetical protein
MTNTNQESLEALGTVWDAALYKKLDEDEERYIELMNEEELTHEEHEFCREFESKMNTSK